MHYRGRFCCLRALWSSVSEVSQLFLVGRKDERKKINTSSFIKRSTFHTLLLLNGKPQCFRTAFGTISAVTESHLRVYSMCTCVCTGWSVGKDWFLKKMTLSLLSNPHLWYLVYFQALNYSWEIIITGLQSVKAEYTDDRQELPRHTDWETSDIKTGAGQNSQSSAILTLPEKTRRHTSSLLLVEMAKKNKNHENMKENRHTALGLPLYSSIVKLTTTGYFHDNIIKWCPHVELLNNQSCCFFFNKRLI